MAQAEDASPPSEDAEDIIALWCLRYAVLSNVELAHLSNCSKRWRQAAHYAVIEQISHPIKGETLLLLPSMVRCLMNSEAMNSTRINFHGNSNLPGERTQRLESEPDKRLEHHETFCAAWFDPLGIQELRISLSNSGIISVSDEELSHNNQNSKSSPLVFGEPIYEVSDNEDANKDDTRSSRSSRKQQNRHPQRSAATFSKMSRSNGATSTTVDDRVATCYEWQGYSTAMEVLRHFGYRDAFVNEIFKACRRNTDEPTNHTLSNGSHQATRPDDSESRQNPTIIHQKDRATTYAVRGAVIARPESYCDCVDLAVERLRKIRFAAAANDNEDEFSNIRMQEYKQSLIRKEIRRRQLQRDVLPRIVSRSFVSASDSKHSRCVQFLNASGGHAVCMLTPTLACGPLVEPVTIFCVGIATEDGCFLSGLHHRFELGHLYPKNEIDEISEQSPVCISTEFWGVDGRKQLTQQNQTGQNITNDQSIHSCEEDDVDRDGDEDNDDDDYKNGDSNDDDADDDSYGNSSEEAWISRKCDCSFKGVGEKISALDEGKPRLVHHGHLGPGAWHCYVAVFDGDKSFIRIDGVAEPMQTENLDGDEETPHSRAMLDGLTIGSDHCFGMSLCCGNGSGGEGEGAIAELAVFQGRLALDDIQAIEKKLIRKHGLVAPSDVSCSDSHGTSMSLWKENDFARQAHALFFLPETDDGITNLPTSSSRPSQIPLRFLSQHRSVAWKQSNPVTGEPIHVHRIGCKPGGASSSDL